MLGLEVCLQLEHSRRKLWNSGLYLRKAGNCNLIPKGMEFAAKDHDPLPSHEQRVLIPGNLE